MMIDPETTHEAAKGFAEVMTKAACNHGRNQAEDPAVATLGGAIMLGLMIAALTHGRPEERERVKQTMFTVVCLYAAMEMETVQ